MNIHYSQMNNKSPLTSSACHGKLPISLNTQKSVFKLFFYYFCSRDGCSSKQLGKCAIFSIKELKKKWLKQNMVSLTKGKRQSMDQKAGFWDTFFKCHQLNLWYKRECSLVILSIVIYLNNKSKGSLSIYGWNYDLRQVTDVIYPTDANETKTQWKYHGMGSVV